MAFKMKAGKEGPMKKNFPGAFKEDKTVKVRGGGKVKISTSKDTESATYDRRAGINRLMNEYGTTREEAIKMLDASKSSRKKGESPNKKKNPNVQGSKAKAYQRKLDKAAKKTAKAEKKIAQISPGGKSAPQQFTKGMDTSKEKRGDRVFDRKVKAADRKLRKADKKRAKADKKIAKISGYYKFLSKDEKKAMR